MDPSNINLPHLRVRPRVKNHAALDHATRLILRVCRLVGPTSVLDDARGSDEVASAIRDRNTAVLFDWLAAALSYQGISDQVASDYMDRHGLATWQAIERDLGRAPTCPKLRGYWHFHGCQYNKSRYTCAEPDHLPGCPYQIIGCATGGSIRLPTRCICSFATLLTAISSAGSTGG
jgi:hypothetical protein